MLRPLIVLSLCLFLFSLGQAEADRKIPRNYDVPAALQPSRLKQKQQNLAANRFHLSRFVNIGELQKFVLKDGPCKLVSLSDTGAYYLDLSPKDGIGHLDLEHRRLYFYTRIWVKSFLDTELGEVNLITGDHFKIAGLVRTQEYQKLLRKHKKNRVRAIGGKKWWQKSSHFTAATVDISYDGMSKASKELLRKRLEEFEKQEKVIAIEEFGQRHFHIMVLPSYVGIKSCK